MGNCQIPLNSKAEQLDNLHLSVRDVVASDASAVLKLHTLVFGSDVDAFWFEWKYGQAVNQGQGQAVGAWHGDELVAFCGGLPRTLWQRGESVNGLQICDVMVHPAWRGILTRRGPFYHVSTRLYESRLGSRSDRPFQIGFGFPSARHLRLAVLSGLLHDAGVINLLRWDIARFVSQRLTWLWCWQELMPAMRGFDQAVDSAWASMRGEAAGLLVGQRDARYLRWRYAARPDGAGLAANADLRYRFFGLRRLWSSNWLGIAVLDCRGTTVQWLDWIGPIELMTVACAWCRIEAGRAGAGALTAWASSAVIQALLDTDFSSQGACAGLGVPVRSAIGVDEVQAMNIWLMGGDTDFL